MAGPGNHLRTLFVGYNTVILPVVGPKRTWQILQREWIRPDSIGLIRLVRLAICLALFALPTIYIDLLIRSRSKASIAVAREIYYVVVFVFLIVALFADWHTSTLVVAFTIYFLADALIHLGGQVFVWGNESIDSSRSLLLALLNYFDMTIGFAVLYRHWEGLSIKPLSAMKAFYFSLVTSATVGYGDITPDTDAGRILVIVQIATAFLFVAVIISALLGRAAANAPVPPAPTNQTPPGQ